MSRGLLWFITIVSSIFFAIGVLFYVAKNNDGPLEIISGGPFQSGEQAGPISDWSFLREKMTVELQTMDPPTSRTMWLVVVDNRLFVISSYMKSRVGRLWKKWPHALDEDNRALIRSDGVIYAMTLERRMEDASLAAVLDRFNEKYRNDISEEDISSGSSWLYELVPSDAGTGS